MLTGAIIGAADFKTVAMDQLGQGAIFVYHGAICFTTELVEGGRPLRAFVYLTGPYAFQLRAIEGESLSVLQVGNIRDNGCRIRLQLLAEPRPSEALLNGGPRRGTVVIDDNGSSLWVQTDNNRFHPFSLATFAQSELPANRHRCWWVEGWKMSIVSGAIADLLTFEIAQLAPPTPTVA